VAAEKEMRKNLTRYAMLGILPIFHRQANEDEDPVEGYCKSCLAVGLSVRQTALHFFVECPDAVEWNYLTWKEIPEYLNKHFQSRKSLQLDIK
jgi:hypothetical protein